jgi:tRNA pseudouridine55 synthase
VSAARIAHRHGLLLIDKPAGLTSHDVVARMRKLAGQKRVGHSGTLDPMATGLMVLLLGVATGLEPWLSGLDKSYCGQLELGLSTDTDDLEGRLLKRTAGPWPSEEALVRALGAREGWHEQVPPSYSAVKVQGRRAHQSARAGQPLELAARRVWAGRLRLVSYQPPLADFQAEVGSGYYIRSLARDLGRELGPGAALSRLRRETVGPWSLSRAAGLEQVAAWSEEDWGRGLIPPAEALPDWPALVLSDEESRRFFQGQTLARPEEPAGQYRILDPSGRLSGLGRVHDQGSLGAPAPRRPYLRPLRVFNYGD